MDRPTTIHVHIHTCIPHNKIHITCVPMRCSVIQSVTCNTLIVCCIHPLLIKPTSKVLKCVFALQIVLEQRECIIYSILYSHTVSLNPFYFILNQNAYRVIFLFCTEHSLLMRRGHQHRMKWTYIR